MKSALRTTFAAATALLLMAACEPADEPERQPGQFADTLPAADAARDPAVHDLAATLSEWNIRLGQDTVAPGSTVIRARNNGQFPHALEVERNGEEWETDPIEPGAWADLEVDLEPGTYEVYCPIDDEHGNHEQMGMRTELVVRAAGG